MQPSRRRALLAVAVALAVLNLALVSVVAYPLSERDPRSAKAAFDQPDGEQYRVEATLRNDGEVTLAVEGVVSASGQRYVRIRQPTVVTEQYQPDGAEGRQFTRTVVDRPQAERLLEQIESDDDRDVRRTQWDGDTLTVVSVTSEPGADLVESLPGSVSVVTGQLRLANYRRVEAERDRRDRLRPRPGWYRGSDPYRLTDVSGSVTVESGTNAIYAANVTWDLTRNTETYAHYLVNRRNAVTQRVTYRYEAGTASVDEPEWVEAARNESAPSTR